MQSQSKNKNLKCLIKNAIIISNITDYDGYHYSNYNYVVEFDKSGKQLVSLIYLLIK